MQINVPNYVAIVYLIKHFIYYAMKLYHQKTAKNKQAQR